MKEETLEEATKNYVDYCACNVSENEDLADADKRGFIYGTKWQQERSYSEEDLEVAFFEGQFGRYSFNDWFEQFKKL